MKFYEIKITLLLKIDVKFIDLQEFLSSNINRAMVDDDYLKTIHTNKMFKPYCIGSLYPFDLEHKVYKANQIYVLTLRSIDNLFIKKLSTVLKKSHKLDFKVIAIESLVKNYSYVESAFTLTPTVISVEDEKTNKIKHWTKEDSSLEFVKRQIKNNLEKKYLQFFNEKIVAPDDFINFISIQNRKPIMYNYKNIKIFTNKFKITFASDELSQKLAFLGFGVGILEKNSLGFGFLTKGK